MQISARGFMPSSMDEKFKEIEKAYALCNNYQQATEKIKGKTCKTETK